MKRMMAGVFALGLAGAAQADGLPFGKEWAGDLPLPAPYGIGVDVFRMHQGYEIESLQFVLPGVPAIPADLVKVESSVQHKDLKLDAWIFPFLNVFGIYGNVNARTDVDLSGVPTAQLGLPPLGEIPVYYSGAVYGAGVTLAVGGEHWFTSVTGTWTRTNLSGDFDSKVSSQTLQPRVGYWNGPFSVWVGGQQIKTEEDHVGTFQLVPLLPPVPFAVSLRESADWTPMFGARYAFKNGFELTAEFGGGERRTHLINGTWRFGGGAD
jgi:hypothetical protein